MPKIKPMLCKLMDKPFDREGWFFEVKWDGYRAIAEMENGKIKLYSRNGLDFSKKYPSIVKALEKFNNHDFILDGEIVALKNGKPDFHTLQAHEENRASLLYMVFDLLYLDGENFRKKPLRERKGKLRGLIKNNKTILVGKYIENHGLKFFETMKKGRIEGMVAKDSNSLYEEGKRSGKWVKVRVEMQQEAVILGYTKPRLSRKYLGVLVLGAYVSGRLQYIGHSGGGFTGAELKKIHQKLQKIKIKKSPVSEVSISSPVTWVKPKYVCQVKFTEWTPEGRMRHPVYTGLRIDKKPKEVIREIPEK